MTKTSWCAALGLAVAGAVALDADTLILRDGRRIDGELVAVSEQIVEFRETGRRRLTQLNRDDVRAIELDARVYGRPVDPRPRGLRERVVTVPGNVPFVDSGIEVREGQELYFESAGDIYWKPRERSGPAGDPGANYDPRRPMPRRPTGAMIAKVGEDSSDLFFIGADPGPIRVQSSGRLFLGVNDDYLQDNHGNFRVVVYY